MSGLVKQKEYKVEDSNVENIGSDMDKAARKEAAMGEKCWMGAGEKPGLKIWRINKFQVVEEPKANYGKFYKGDSYILLHTIQEEEDGKMIYDLFFWIGKESTMDEYGTAAYKTVELDAYLDDAATQYREVQNNESAKFKALFTKKITYLEGGNESGFNKVADMVQDVTQLFRFKPMSTQELKLDQWNKINAEYVYVLLTKDCICKYNGSRSKATTRWDCQNWLDGDEIKGRRPSARLTIIDDDDEAVEELQKHMTAPMPEDFDIKKKKTVKEAADSDEIVLYRTDGTSDWMPYAYGNDIGSMSSLEDNCLHMLDLGTSVILYDKRPVGKKVPSSMVLAQEHLNKKESKKLQRAMISGVKDEQVFVNKLAATKK